MSRFKKVAVFFKYAHCYMQLNYSVLDISQNCSYSELIFHCGCNIEIWANKLSFRLNYLPEKSFSATIDVIMACDIFQHNVNLTVPSTYEQSCHMQLHHYW